MSPVVQLAVSYGGWLAFLAILTALGYFGARLEALEAQERKEYDNDKRN